MNICYSLVFPKQIWTAAGVYYLNSDKSLGELDSGTTSTLQGQHWDRLFCSMGLLLLAEPPPRGFQGLLQVLNSFISPEASGHHVGWGFPTGQPGPIPAPQPERRAAGEQPGQPQPHGCLSLWWGTESSRLGWNGVLDLGRAEGRAQGRPGRDSQGCWCPQGHW